ncbi:tetratricopeptide repeat protein [Ekhidna sp.]
MRLIVISFLTALTLCVNATTRVDSLKAELLNHSFEDEQKVSLLNSLGYEYWIINPVQSIIYGQQAKALAEILQDSSGLALSNRIVGVGHWARGSYDQGLEYLLNSLSLYKSLSDTLGEANCLMNLGLIYSDRFDNELALEYFFEAIKLFDTIGAKDRSATTYVKLSTILIRQRKFYAANIFLDSAVLIHGANKFRYGMSEILNRYGVLKTAMGEYDSAVLYLDHSLQLSKKIEDLDGVIRNQINLADVALKTEKNNEAEILLNAALISAREIQSHKWLTEIYDRLQKIARKKGNLEEAINYYDQYLREKDSIFNLQTLNNISRLESELATTEQKRQLAAKENKIVILEQETEIQRIRVYILIFVILAVVILGILLIRNRRLVSQRKEQQAQKQADDAKKEVEFKNRELVSYTVNFVQKNQLFEELMDSVSEMKKSSSGDNSKVLLGMERTINRHLQVDRDWEDFKLRFENLHSGFFDKILEREPSLTGNDLKLCALSKMNFSIKEISEMMGISTESVKTARYRLKKKLELPGEMSINDFLNTVG